MWPARFSFFIQFNNDTQLAALVSDTANRAPGAKIVLNAVDFAAIVGAADVTSNTSGQILTGDLASQQFTVSDGNNSLVFSGGGSDTLVFNTTTSAPAGRRAGGAMLRSSTATARTTSSCSTKASSAVTATPTVWRSGSTKWRTA